MYESEKWKWRHSVVSDSSWPHGLQPTRLPRPWDFPGKSTGVGCHCLLCFSDGAVVKNLSAIAGDMSSTPGSGWSPGGGNGNPLQYSCLENPMHKRIIWWATVLGVTENQTWPSNWACTTILRDHTGTEIIPRARAEDLKLKEYLVEYHKSPCLRSRKK